MADSELLVSLRIQAENLATDVIDKTAEAMKGLGSAVQSVAADMEGALGGALGGLGAGLEAVAIPAAALTASLGAAGIAALDFGNKYQTAMVQVQNMGELTNQQTQQLQSTFIQLSDTTDKSFTNIASAVAPVLGLIEQIPGAQGNTVKATQEMTQAAIMLADANHSELGPSLDALATLMRAYGLRADDASHVANELMAVQVRTGMSVSELEEAYARLHTRMGDTKPDIAESGALLEILTQHGISGTRAIMAVSQALENMYAGDFPKVRAGLEAVGIATHDANGNFLPFKDVIDQLHQKFQQLAPDQQIYIAGVLASSLGQQGLNTIVDAGGNTIEDYANQIRNSTDATDGQARAQQTLGYQLHEFVNILENDVAAAGQAVLPDLAAKAATVVEAFRQWSPMIIAVAAAVMEGMGSIVSAMVSGLGTILDFDGR